MGSLPRTRRGFRSIEDSNALIQDLGEAVPRQGRGLLVRPLRQPLDKRRIVDELDDLGGDGLDVPVRHDEPVDAVRDLLPGPVLAVVRHDRAPVAQRFQRRHGVALLVGGHEEGGRREECLASAWVVAHEEHVLAQPESVDLLLQPRKDAALAEDPQRGLGSLGDHERERVDRVTEPLLRVQPGDDRERRSLPGRQGDRELRQLGRVRDHDEIVGRAPPLGDVPALLVGECDHPVEVLDPVEYREVVRHDGGVPMLATAEEVIVVQDQKEVEPLVVERQDLGHDRPSVSDDEDPLGVTGELLQPERVQLALAPPAAQGTAVGVDEEEGSVLHHRLEGRGAQVDGAVGPPVVAGRLEQGVLGQVPGVVDRAIRVEDVLGERVDERRELRRHVWAPDLELGHVSRAQPVVQVVQMHALDEFVVLDEEPADLGVVQLAVERQKMRLDPEPLDEDPVAHHECACPPARARHDLVVERDVHAGRQGEF